MCSFLSPLPQKSTPPNRESVIHKGIGERSSTMEFIAEIKRTSQRKMASLDNVFQIVLETENPMILDLGKLPSDKTVKVIIEVDNG